MIYSLNAWVRNSGNRGLWIFAYGNAVKLDVNVTCGQHIKIMYVFNLFDMLK